MEEKRPAHVYEVVIGIFIFMLLMFLSLSANNIIAFNFTAYGMLAFVIGIMAIEGRTGAKGQSL